MNGYNFTDGVRRSLAAAREEAQRLGHEYVGTEHVLLGLIAQGDEIIAALWPALRVDPAVLALDVRAAVRVAARPGAAPTDAMDLPWTSRAKKVLELSMHEARALDDRYVGTEHLLLGTLAEQHGVAARVLGAHGLTLPAVRLTVVALPQRPHRRAAASEAAPDSTATFRMSAVAEPVSVAITAVTLRLHLADGTTIEQDFQTAAQAAAFLQRAR